MLARLALRSKLLLVGSIPLLVLVLFAGLALRDAYTSMSRADADASLFGPFRALTQVAEAAGDERIGAAWYQHIPDDGPAASDALMLNTRDAMDVAVDRLLARVPDTIGRVGPDSERAIHAAVRDLHGLSAARIRINRHEDPGAVYDRVSRSAMTAAETLLREFYDRDLASSSRAVLDLARAQVALATEGRVVIDHLAGGTTPDLGRWVAAVTEQRAEASRFSVDADAAQRAAFVATPAARPAHDPVRGDSLDALPTRLPKPGDLDPEAYASWYSGRQAALGVGTSKVVDAVGAAFAVQQSSTRSGALGLAIGAALAILLVVALSYLVARSVTRPIRALTRGARDMAERRLPRLVDTLRRGGELTDEQLERFTPIRVDSHDEIAELAKAFNTVQDVTVAVAEQQAALLRKGIGDLYVNLARRNQSLLDRQLGLLDDMEARVDEPDELGSLFELDHLATRMRRNAESLLVLSGAEQPRQWQHPVPVLDVARGAAAEIADFARVSYFGFDDDLAVAGNAVADVSHILAELLENAAAFSPPSSPVVVAGHRAERRFVITIADEGIGMDDDRLAAANALLARPPAPGLSLSRTLGLYVVAHLARRHGINVQLRPSPGTGLTAVVALPAGVLARLDPEPGTASSRPEAPAPGAFVAEPVESWTRVSAPPMTEPRRPWPAPSSTRAEPVASRAEPVSSFTWGSGARDDPLPRRNGGAEAEGARPVDDAAHGLPSRTPGANLSEAPSDRVTATASAARPHPERVAELLQRHERGKREGRERSTEVDW